MVNVVNIFRFRKSRPSHLMLRLEVLTKLETGKCQKEEENKIPGTHCNTNLYIFFQDDKFRQSKDHFSLLMKKEICLTIAVGGLVTWSPKHSRLKKKKLSLFEIFRSGDSYHTMLSLDLTIQSS